MYFIFWHMLVLSDYPVVAICQLFFWYWLCPHISLYPGMCQVAKLLHEWCSLLILICISLLTRGSSCYRFLGIFLCVVWSVPHSSPLLLVPWDCHICWKYFPQLIICLLIEFVDLLFFLLYFTRVLNICIATAVKCSF